MKRKIMLSVMTAALLLSNGITALAAPEVINVGGVNTVFDAEYYASANPDVVAALGTNRDLLIQHYTACGKAEGRPAYAPNTDVNALLSSAVVTPVQQKKIKTKIASYSNGSLTVTEEYDEQGNCLKETSVDSMGEIRTGTYTYDAQGNKLKEVWVNADGTTDTVTYTYDVHGNVVKEVKAYNIYNGSYPDTVNYNYTYDAQGNILTGAKVDADGIIYNYTYDAQGNIVYEVRNIDGETDTVTYIYDAHGNLLSEQLVSGGGYTDTITYTYDAHNNVLTEQQVAGRYTNTKTYAYEYDAQGNVVTKVRNIDGETETTICTYNEYGDILSRVTIDNVTGNQSIDTYFYTYY